MATKIIKPNTKYLNQIGRRIVTSKNKFFRRNLHLNHRDLGINILRIKDSNQLYEETMGYKEMDPNICFFIYHVYKNDLNKWLNKANNKEIVVTDSTNNKVIEFTTSEDKLPDFINIWILKFNSSNIYKINIGDILFTR